MKKFISLFVFPLLLVCSCDDWFGVDWPQDDTPESYVDTPVDPVTPDITIEDPFVPEDEEDAIDNTSFDSTISVTFSTAGATVTGDEDGIVTVSGNAVTVNNTTDKKIRYVLSGSAEDGFFKIYGEKKQALVLDGLDLTNPNGAAINNQNKKRTFVVLQGSNKLADGKKYTATPEEEDEKAAFFSEAQLIFSGSGSLTVTATGKAGITSDDYVRILDDPTISISSTGGHGLRGKDAVMVGGGKLDISVSKKGKKAISTDGTARFDGGATTLAVSGGVDDSDLTDLSGSSGIKADAAFVMNGGSLTVTNSGQGGKGISGDLAGLIAGGTVDITVTGTNYEVTGADAAGLEDTTTSAKGIKFDGKLVITGGSVTVSAKNHEAIEAKGDLVITGGIVCATSSDDAINAGGNLVIDGGRVCALSTGNDGLDANGDCYIQGGIVYASSAGGAEVGVDANTEGGHTLYVIGGTLVSVGGLERGSHLSQACYAANWSRDTWYALYSDNKVAFIFKTPASGGNGMVVSTAGDPTLLGGVNISGGSPFFDGMANEGCLVAGGTQIVLSAYSSGSAMGGPGGPGGFGPGR